MVVDRGGRREWEGRGNSAGFIIIGRWSSASGIGKTDAAVYSPTDEENELAKIIASFTTNRMRGRF